MIRSIHPFPARMAPELALASLADLPQGSVVLDPMSGSGTVIRQAAEMGHRPVGFDMDPLAVLMSRVWTRSVKDDLVEKISTEIFREARILRLEDATLPWVDESAVTTAFIKYWFGQEQQEDLRRLAFVLHKFSQRRFSKEKQAAADVVRIALSRIIVTKEQGASLARDTSHSRPHKVASSSNYDVFDGLSRSIKQVRKRLTENPEIGNSTINLGDARSLRSLKSASVDAVLTSPPYLNAIDYLRGHRMSLVWLGYQIENLRTVRSNSIGAERAPNLPLTMSKFEPIQGAMCSVMDLEKKYRPMVARYSEDLYKMVKELSRVTKPGGLATFVVGNSCLKGTFINNSAGVAAAARMVGFREVRTYERDLPSQNRYLPLTENGALGKRMRTETIITFERAFL